MNTAIVTHNNRPTLMLLVGNGRPGVTIGTLDPDGDDRDEIGWTEREEGWG